MKAGHCYDCADPYCGGAAAVLARDQGIDVERSGGPLWALVATLERLEADARDRSRRAGGVQGDGGRGAAEAAAYKNAAALVASIASGGES